MNNSVIKEDDFNNMVPHFSKKQIINDYNEQTYAHRMELFSGSSKNFTPKKELLKENFNSKFFTLKDWNIKLEDRNSKLISLQIEGSVKKND